MRRFIAAWLAGTLVACSSSPRPAGLTPIRLAIHQAPIAFLPVRVAQTLGYYAEDGLAVDMSEVVGGTKALQALIGGSVDVAAASMPDALQLVAQAEGPITSHRSTKPPNNLLLIGCAVEGGVVDAE